MAYDYKYVLGEKGKGVLKIIQDSRLPPLFASNLGPYP